MLTITDSAREKFKELMTEHDGKFLRVVFEGFGWGGPSLGLALDESKNEEQTYTVNEIELMIDEKVMPYTKGNEIDYINNSYGQGFSIAPPTTGGCGC